MHRLTKKMRHGIVALLFGAFACMAATGAAHAQELEQRKAATEQELAAIREKISLSQQRKQELDAEIAKLETDRATLNRNLIDTSARARRIEDRIGRAAGRLEELRGQEDELRVSLKERRGVLIEVIAALQRMGHKPPPALLVRPEDALASVRSAILLGAVLPEIRSETEVLAVELAELARIKGDITANRSELESEMNNLAEEEERLSLLLEEKKKLSNTAREELARQTALAAQLAGKATSLTGLIGELESEIGAARAAAEAARKAEEERRRLAEQQLAEARQEIKRPDFSDTDRISPAVAFPDAKGLLPKPVSGVELTKFGHKSADGEIAQGLSIATRSGSRVVAPSDGWVIYAGPFRSYGQLLILNAGNEYHIVLAGMERINVSLGQFVLAGEPVGVMGDSRIASAGNVDVASLRPVLYVEFRKEGNPIDPSDWWAASGMKEENG